MKAEIKYLICPDIDKLESFVPEKNDEFCILVQAILGPKNDLGEESFDFLVCTPKWIETDVEKNWFLFGKGYLIVHSFNYNKIMMIILDLCNRISGKDWGEIAIKISRFGNWEFENYSAE